jgi:formiminotetrahydrofolate cyclodeaminase
MVTTLSTVAVGVWAIAQKVSLRRSDVDSIVKPILERLDKLTAELTTLAKESVQRGELQVEINRLKDDIREEKKERLEEVQGVRNKIVNHLTEHHGGPRA